MIKSIIKASFSKITYNYLASKKRVAFTLVVKFNKYKK